MTNPRAEVLADLIKSLRAELMEAEERQAELYRQLNSALREYRSLTVDPDDIPDPTSAKASPPSALPPGAPQSDR